MKVEKMDREAEQYTIRFHEPEIIDMLDLLRAGLAAKRDDVLKLADSDESKAYRDYLLVTIPDYGLLVGAWEQLLDQVFPEEAE